MTQIFHVDFNDGQDEGADRIALPDGKLRALINGRLTRDGRIEVSPAFTALSMTDPQVGTLVAKDITTYRDRLVAFTSLGQVSNKPGYLSAYVDGAEVWQTAPQGPFPAFEHVAGIWQNPSGAAARQFDLAYANSQICVVQVDDSNVLTIVRMLTDGTELMRTQVSPISSARVVACGNTFVLVTRSTLGTMAARTFDTTATTDTFSSATTLEATVATGAAHWDLASIPSSTDYLVTYPRPGSNNVRLRRYTVAHSLVGTLDRTAASAAGDSAVIAASSSVGLWAIQDGNDIVLTAFDATVTATSGPTVRATVAGVRAPGLCLVSGSTTTAWLVYTTATASSCSRVVISSTGTLAIDASAPNVWGASKPVAFADGTTLGNVYVVGQLPTGGNNTGSSLNFFTSCIYDAQLPANVHGTWDYGIASPLNILSASDTGGRSSIVTDGAYHYALTTYERGLEIGASVPGGLRLVRLGRAFRHQTAEAGGALYISGGTPVQWDGAVLGAASFVDVPRITATSQDASGSQTPLATYNYVLTYEYTDATGAISRSTPSDPLAVTMTGANNRVILTCSTPRSGKTALGIYPRVVVWRSSPSDSVFFRVAESGDLSGVDISATTTINDGVADTTAQTHEVLYVQSQKPTANVAPPSCRHMSVGCDRIICGGLVNQNQVALSQLFFPGEPVEWASPNSFAHTLRMPEAVTAVEARGSSYTVFTGSAIYAIPGAGPQRNGTGEFGAPQVLYSDGGCIDWRSVVSCGQGTFFQLASDKLYILREGGGVEWIGQPVRDTLALYPTITGACLCTETQTVVFSCTDAAGTGGVHLIYDLRRGVWSVDDQVVSISLVEYLGRLARVASTQTVFLESATAKLTSTMSVRTGSFRLFKPAGWGSLCSVTLLGTYLGDSTVEAFCSYDDGKTWTTLGSQAATAAALGYASGDPVTLQFFPAVRDTDRFALRFDVTPLDTTGGSRLHGVSLEVDGQIGSTRQPARNQR